MAAFMHLNDVRVPQTAQCVNLVVEAFLARLSVSRSCGRTFSGHLPPMMVNGPIHNSHATLAQ
jgi:hypothetical protein